MLETVMVGICLFAVLFSAICIRGFLWDARRDKHNSFSNTNLNQRRKFKLTPQKPNKKPSSSPRKATS